MPSTLEMNFCPRCGHPLTDMLKYGKMRRTCTQCNYVHFHDPVVAAVVFAMQNNRLLMVRRAVNPERGAGYIDYEEDPHEAAAREVLEETGLEINVTRVIDVLGRDTSAGAKASIVILFEGEIVGGNPLAQDDASEVAFFALDEIPIGEIASFKSISLVLERWRAASS